MGKRRFIIGCEELEDGMIIEAENIDEAKDNIISRIDVHEVDKNDDIIN